VFALEKVSRSINNWIESLLFGIGLSMTVIVAIQVFSRYVLNHSLFWSEELARYLLVWLTFLGASVAYRRKAHPGIDVVIVRASPSVQKLFRLVVHFASILLFGVMILFGFKFSYFVRMQISPALHLPKWIIFSIIPISGFILMIHGLAFLFGEVKGIDRDN
jgi:TRAP-type C4-dicarboxylate transport system permease small subunit